ncbi:hypothetical protein L209DRAFT_322293 [Thermothelomyces heterothallicus CBS 203.75]
MPAPQSVSSNRRPILRFDLVSISIDDKPNAYKKPQLVLKPQLELAPRRPYTGSRPRMPVWRHFLMVHVEDKADELIRFEHLQSALRSEPTQSFAFNHLFIAKELSSFPVFDKLGE